MRQQIVAVAKSFVDNIKSPLGLTIIGGLAGSSATYFFSRTKLAQDLAHAQTDKQQLEERVLKLENENTDIARQNRELLIINTNHLIKSDALRDELRQTSKEMVVISNRLDDCKRNPWSFWKYYANNDIKSDVPVPKNGGSL